MKEINFINNYIKELEGILPKLPIEEIKKVADLFVETYENENYIFTMGNGGHGSTASHFVNDLLKHTIVSDEKNEVVIHNKRFKALSLNDSIATITTWANDVSFDVCFSEQLKNWMKKGDLVIGFSASGNSKNILKAFETAKDYRAKSIAFTGGNGGKMKILADISIVIPTNNYLYIEDMHLVIAHIITNLVRAKIQKKL
ncbi:MAG: SIS domain-containing protein [Actinobacteria bacterium]|nr:SIS domain-containing protein [Actinomycetota bacterium]